MLTRRIKTTTWISGAVIAVVALPVLGFGLIFGSNMVAGIFSLVFERQPSLDEMAGFYKFHGSGQRADILLRSNGTFEEQVTGKGGLDRVLDGKWTYRYDSNEADITFSSLINPSDNAKVYYPDAGEKAVENFTLLCYKPRFGRTYLQLDPDTGDEFRKQISIHKKQPKDSN